MFAGLAPGMVGISPAHFSFPGGYEGGRPSPSGTPMWVQHRPVSQGVCKPPDAPVTHPGVRWKGEWRFGRLHVRVRRCARLVAGVPSRWFRSLRPVASLHRTSRHTKAANRASFLPINRRTALGSRATNALSAHESTFTTISSRSPISRVQIRRVRPASPRPPLALTFNGTVLTRAARRHQPFFDWPTARSRDPRSDLRATPGLTDSRQSNRPDTQLGMPEPRCSSWVKSDCQGFRAAGNEFVTNKAMDAATSD